MTRGVAETEQDSVPRIESMRNGSGVGDKWETVLRIGSADWGGTWKSAGDGRNAKERLPLFSKGRHAEHVCTASFVIEKDGL